MQEKEANNTKTIHRLSEYTTKMGISFNKLAIELGLSNSYFNKMVKNGGSIGSDIIENILRIYPDISADWLLTGNGSMLRSESPKLSVADITPTVVPTASPDSSAGEATAYYKMYERKDKENKLLIEEIGALKERLRRLEGIPVLPTNESLDNTGTPQKVTMLPVNLAKKEKMSEL